MDEKRCETCGSSSELYKDPECPYMVCDTGEIVTRWNSCDDWKEKHEIHDNTDRESNEGDASCPRRILPTPFRPDL